jgi:pyruvate dehydrogenase E2 component (dihydrolipoamide acetyltransferase)
MEAGTLVEWLVKPGDQVKRGDVVAVVETQKGAIEIEIFESGQVESILVELDTKVPVGTPLAHIRTDEEAESGAAAVVTAPPRIAPAPAVREVPLSAPPVMSAPSGVTAPSAGRVRASPAARRLAQTRGVDLGTTPGSGPGGTIVRADVERSLVSAVAPAEKKRSVGLDLDAMRAAIATAMARSKREIPHYYLAHHVDVGKCEAWLARTNAERPPDRRLLMGALTLKAVALAARRFPAVNGFYREGK